MIKEAKDIDFLTTGRQPSEKDFERISDWIKKDKTKQSLNKGKKRLKREKQLPKQALVTFEA